MHSPKRPSAAVVPIADTAARNAQRPDRRSDALPSADPTRQLSTRWGARSTLDDDMLGVDVGAPRTWPRLLTRKLAAAYLSCSEREIDRLIAVGAISVVRLPVTRHKSNVPIAGKNRRVLIDRAELDALCVKAREQVGR